MDKIDESKIQNWIVEENIFKQKISDDQSNFHYVIEYPEGNVMDIVQPKEKGDILIFVCATQVAPEHIEMIKDKTIPFREDFVFDLRLELNKLDSDFQLNVNEEYVLSQFIIQDFLYSDGLTKNSMMKIIKNIYKAKTACIWMLEKKFEIPMSASPIISPSSDDNVMFM